ncbi:uncharacterized protein LOC119601555 [Lucilia sericata]|uniref:uncharacterized protein LOC119601555 n=1 Tax=Lucilia sericata TaxID=13632 RepID=UPI0018A82417|nr:uncharacterized protein LOC119601555 [Lucilia sericata]
MIFGLFSLLLYYEYHIFFKSIPDDCLYSNQTETFENSTTSNNENDTTTSKRIKRFLIFQGGGVVKLVFGTSYPIIMADKTKSLSYFYNFQMQYPPPTIPVYWWSLYNTSTFAARRNARKRSTEMLLSYDRSRSLIYDFMETILQRFGDFGGECLLKVICEVARAPLIEDMNASNEGSIQMHITDNDENGILDDNGRNIYHKLINLIFTPLRSNVDERYINARIAGETGANCGETFGKCPIVEKFFKRYTQYV